MLGPALSGSLVEGVGFKAMLFGIAIICFLYGPLLYFLKNPPHRTEQEKAETTVNENVIVKSFEYNYCTYSTVDAAS
jgi:DHA1 family solute carrier family 18 vesicular amine transporter 1/2